MTKINIIDSMSDFEAMLRDPFEDCDCMLSDFGFNAEVFAESYAETYGFEKEDYDC